MSRTSQALKRLGVAGVVVATIGAGVPAFFATAASAAGPTAQLTISPAAQTGASGTCLLYSVTPTDSAGAVPSDTVGQTIRLTATPTGAGEVEFCQPSPNYPRQGTASTTNPIGGARTPASGATATPATAGTTAASNGTQTFGVRGLAPGGATIRAFIDNNPANGSFDAGEASGTATATFSAGGNNETDTSAGGNAAQDAAKTITEVAQSATANPIAAGNTSASDQFVTVQVKNTSGEVLSGVVVKAQFGASSANGAQAATGTTAAQPAQTITCRTGGTTTATNGTTTFTPTADQTATSGSQGGGTVTNNQGIVSCSYTAIRPGTDTIVLWVDQTSGNTSGPDASEPQLTVTRTTNTAPNTTATDARNVDVTPEGPIDTVSGTTRTFTATVTDAAGKRVQGVAINWTKTGGGNLANATSPTNAFGQATVQLTSVVGETGQAVVTATIATAGTFCGSAAGTPAGTTTAGNCADSEVTNFVASSPSPSASATSSSTASPSNSPSSGGRGTLSTSTPDIQPNIQGILTATGLTAGAVYELRCYSRPSTTYFTARSATVSADASSLEFRILPGTNTRCYVRPAGNESLASNSVVINVHTTLSLSTVRTGIRTYIFQGRNLPRRSGQLITLYRVANGQEIRTSNLVTDASGIYRVTRTFTGTGTFQFRVRTSQTLTNAPGVSNTINVRVF